MSDITYSTGQVAAMTRVSERQLQWWDERGVVMPRHVGHRRVYNAKEAHEVHCVAELRRRGLSLQKIRWIIRFLEKHLAARLGDGNGRCYVVTNGDAIHIEIAPERVIEILARSITAMHVIEVRDELPKHKGRIA